MPETAIIEKKSFESLDPKDFIIIKGANVNNLKALDVAIPRHKLVVITGVSGSGKSSLAFDTLFAEGQRMYVESLSSYARQFLGRMEKPEVDYIKGVAPAIAIEQRVSTKNPRSTIGTSTEIYDYMKLLFARIGKTFSPVSGEIVEKHNVEDVVEFIKSRKEAERFVITTPLIKRKNRTISDELKILLSKGYTRIRLKEKEIWFIEELIEENKKPKHEDVEIIIDRDSVKKEDEDFLFRLTDSIQTAFFEGEGRCFIVIDDEKYDFSESFEADGIIFEEPSVNFFSFNNPYGACRKCEGFGKILGIDPDLVIPDHSLSVFEGAVAAWKGETLKKWKENFVMAAVEKYDFPAHRAYGDLNEEQRELLWKGAEGVKGIDYFFKFIESKLHKIQYRVLLSRYRGRMECPDCRGTRLRKDASYVKINEKSITDLVLMSVVNLNEFFDSIKLNKHEASVAERLLKEIQYRLKYLKQVGLEYLTLNRLTSSLSGGEFQRIKLATSLGSALVGSMYILDEPSIGLHPRDTNRLINILKHLRDLGNTVIVVEHEEEIMRAADQVIDIGPDAGVLGGQLVFQGNSEAMVKAEKTHTTRFLLGEETLPLNKKPRQWKNKISIKGARKHNLKNIAVDIPLNALSVVSGVSGSGKSTLISDIIYPQLSRMIEGIQPGSGENSMIYGDWKKVGQVEFVDQNPIGKSSRSNPVTYIKAYDAIRNLYSEQQLSKARAYKPAYFSFNVDGGRCEECQGEGTIKIEMQFMADIVLKCDNCKGKRFKSDVLEVEIKGKNIADILDLTVDEAIEFFEKEKSIINKLNPLQEVGLGYITLGQSSNTLSGGEAQRVKLASFLSKSSSSNKILFIFDEPTTGLHFHDIQKLLKSLQALIAQGHTVLLIEHNLDVIQSADWIIDLGPEGGDKGGEIIFTGTPEEILKRKSGYTSQFLKEKYNQENA